MISYPSTTPPSNNEYLGLVGHRERIYPSKPCGCPGQAPSGSAHIIHGNICPAGLGQGGRGLGRGGAGGGVVWLGGREERPPPNRKQKKISFSLLYSCRAEEEGGVFPWLPPWVYIK